MLLWTSELQSVVHKVAPEALVFLNLNAENNLEEYIIYDKTAATMALFLKKGLQGT